MTSSTHIVPTYRALTIVGNVLDKDDTGEVHHTIVVHTTMTEKVVVTYEIISRR